MSRTLTGLSTSWRAGARALPRAAAILLPVATLSCFSGSGDLPKSLKARLEQRVGRGQIVIEYSRPVARGRRLFGGIVPFGDPWNPGADAATRISFSREVEFEGRPVPKGSYSVWAVPGPDEWTLILSHAARVYHVPYPEGRDALRVAIRPRSGDHMETLGFYFPLVDADSAVLQLHWGETVVPMRLRVR